MKRTILLVLLKRIETLSRESAPPLLLGEIKGAAMEILFGSVAFPGENKYIEDAP